jgi:hypothetical protein
MKACGLPPLPTRLMYLIAAMMVLKISAVIAICGFYLAYLLRHLALIDTSGHDEAANLIRETVAGDLSKNHRR